MGSLNPGVGASDIIDIKQNDLPSDLKDSIIKGLNPAPGEEKSLSTLVLYDEEGLQIYQDITYLEEYYLVNAEIEVLERYAEQIAQAIPSRAEVVELGSGNLRKVRILLEALDRQQKDIDYYALDLDEQELKRTLAEVPQAAFKHVQCHGLHGTYDDGLAWLEKRKNTGRCRVIMSLGSSIGNFGLEDAGDFLRGFRRILGPNDLMIVCVDGCQDKERVYRAYNDSKGTTLNFYRNGLKNANKILGFELFRSEEWDIVGSFEAGPIAKHQVHLEACTDIRNGPFSFKRGERIHLENSYKYSSSQMQQLWQDSGLQVQHSYVDKSGTYSLNMLSRQSFAFPLDPRVYAKSPVPTPAEWAELWKVWDLVTLGMIPPQELHSKPINLRNCCLFYLGHIPTFLDIHLTRATGGNPTEPRHYPSIFERGIDPDVENPELCHAHSEIPDEWPPKEEILEFQQKVRERVNSLYADGTASKDRKVGRALWLGFEHEVMHLETLLYMLLQSDKTLPPPGKRPDFEALARQALVNATPNKWIHIPERKLQVGLDDPENDDGPDRYFGWDNERPPRSITVPAFEAQTQPLTNGDYAQYLVANNSTKYPVSWHVNDAVFDSPPADEQLLNGYSSSLSKSYLENKAVKTVYGPVPLKFALDWPIMASYDELSACARWMNGRIPTMEEARSIYAYVDELDTDMASNVCAKTIPAVNGHLSNDGVEITPPQTPSIPASSGAKLPPKDDLDPESHFAKLQGSNVGFQNFHPVPVTGNDRPAGLAGMGGVWEWTSSVLEKHQDFKAMDLYPGYTEDFFDTKHNIVLGGSWATHPRVAGRKSFVNWYQRNYPYPWVGARLVRDLQT